MFGATEVVCWVMVSGGLRKRTNVCCYTWECRNPGLGTVCQASLFACSDAMYWKKMLKDTRHRTVIAELPLTCVSRRSVTA